jgi:hypothetical protein
MMGTVPEKKKKKTHVILPLLLADVFERVIVVIFYLKIY